MTGCFAASVPLQLKKPSGAYNPIWSNGQPGPSLDATRSGIYWVSYYSEPCTYLVDTFEVSFSGGMIPMITVQGSCANASNGSIHTQAYPGDTITYSYTWMNEKGDVLSDTSFIAAIAPGRYTLRVRTQQCDTILHLSVPAEDYRASFQADTMVCAYEDIFFENTADSYFDHFIWFFGDSSYSELSAPNHHYALPGTYTITLMASGEQCSDTFSRTVIVDERFAGTLSSSKDSICQGETIFFRSEGHHTIQKLQWNFGDSTAMNPPGIDWVIQHSYASSGTMPATLTIHPRACPDTILRKTIKVFATPEIFLGNDTALCINNAPITLSNTRSALPGYKDYYTWSTGETTGTIKARQAGIYSLTVSREPLGCAATETIRISKACYIDVPNAFSPNNDGMNDFFFPRLLSQNIYQFRMLVLNRWGQVLFETADREGRGWDGKYNGKEQPEGVYVYLINSIFNDRHTEVYQGNVTLIR